jgi:hypothetical protein
MPTPKIIEIDEEQDVVCPICNAMIVDKDDGLVSQPSCEHVLWVFCNGECFEYPEKMQERLDAALETADEAGDYFDHWDWLLAQCGEGDVILEQVTEGMACGPVSFKVWIGIRGESESSKSNHSSGRTLSDQEYSPTDRRVFFRPTRVFVRWMKANHSAKHVYEVGCGTGSTASMLAKAGMQVTALDLEPRIHSEYPVVTADSTEYAFEKRSVVLICRPCHNGFVRETVLPALTSGVSAVIYVGLRRNVKQDLGGYFRQFTQRRISGIGHADEHIWEMKISRAQADACLRRGAIPPLSD